MISREISKRRKVVLCDYDLCERFQLLKAIKWKKWPTLKCGKNAKKELRLKCNAKREKRWNYFTTGKFW